MNSQPAFTILTDEQTDPNVALSAAHSAEAAAAELITLARQSAQETARAEETYKAIMRPLEDAPEWARPQMIARLPMWKRQIGILWLQSMIRTDNARATYDLVLAQAARVFTVAQHVSFDSHSVVLTAAQSVSTAAAELAAVLEDGRIVAAWNSTAQAR